MPLAAGTTLMDYTTLGRTRIGQMHTDGLVFDVTHVAYGTGGFNLADPRQPTALVPAATALSAEVFRKSVPAAQIVKTTIVAPRGQETVYTSVSGQEYNDVCGEAGLVATITVAGTTGLPVGQQFLLAHCHFPRICFGQLMEWGIEWPLDYAP